MKFSLFLGGLALLATAGCSKNQFIGRPELATVSDAELPAPDPLGATVVPTASVLGPGDKIAVSVFGVEDLSKEVTVDSSGAIALPLVGSLDVAGRSPQQVSDMIGERLVGRYVRDPDVTVNVVEVVSQVFAIEGEVHKPGLYPLVGQTTLLRAIARGGGTTEFADSNHVVLYRRVENKDMAALYDVRAIRRGVYQDPRIYPGDMVVVSEDRAFRLFGTIVQSSGILLTPLITILNNS